MVTADAAEAATIAAAARKGRPPQRPRVAKEQGTATFFSRVGDENAPGKLARSAHEELAEIDPVYAAAQQLVLDRKALESVSPGLRAMVPLDFNAANSTAGGWSTETLRQNARALGGRVLDPLLDPVIEHAAKASRVVPLLRDPLDAELDRSRRKKRQKERR
jgi:hypothetical protein